MKFKNILKILLILIVLFLLGFGGFKLYNLAKDDKYWDNENDTEKRQEVLSSDDNNVTKDNKEDKKTSDKSSKGTSSTGSKKSDSTSSIDTKSGTVVEKEKDEVITYYKSLNCEEEDHEDDIKIYINYRGDFLATKYQTFSKDTELSNSIIEMKVSVNGYDELTEAEKKEIDNTLRDEADELVGYSLSISHDNDWIIYTWKGNKNAFLKTFDDFGKSKVSYSNFETYFSKQGVTCRES